MRLLNKFLSLSPGDYYVLLWATVMLPAVGWRLRYQGYKRVLSWAHGSSNHHPAAISGTTDRPVHLGKMINFVASKGLYRANCLCRSLVLLRLMRREGLTGDLKIGVPKDREAGSLSVLEAHAWVEYQGVVVNDHADVTSNHAKFDYNQL